jgi:deaminated glutathione amidase
MEDILRVACIQMNSGDQLAVNLLRAAELLRQAAGQGARLALLPENFAFMGASDAAKRRAAQPEETSEALAFLGEHAAALNMAIIGGSVALSDAGQTRLRNTSVAFSATGERLAAYDKMHLFDVDVQGECYRESDLIRPGDKPVTARIEGWKIGLSVCYDVRFPELYRHYSAAGCEILSIPSAFTVPTGRAHWETLLRARAIENQCYVLAAAQAGVHPGGRSTWGHSMIIDPWGEVLASMEEGEGVAIADLSYARQQSLRRQFPVLKHRRTALVP